MGLSDTTKLVKTDMVRAFAKGHPQHKKDYVSIIDNVYSKIVNYCNIPFMSGEGYLEPTELERIFRKTYDLFTILGDEMIFTTNYDPSIEIWCQKRNIKIYDGTEVTNNPEINSISSLAEKTVESGKTYFAYKEASSLKLVRLHGSVWTYETTSGQKLKMNRPKDRLLFTDLYSRLKKRPCIIFPGQEPMLDSGDWDIYYQYFKKMLRRRCLIIGYSFNDELINKVFIDNLKKGRLDKIGIVDPNPDEVIKNLFRKEKVPEKQIIKLPVEFGSDYAVNQIYDKWITGVCKRSYNRGVSQWILEKIEEINEYIK